MSQPLFVWKELVWNLWAEVEVKTNSLHLSLQANYINNILLDFSKIKPRLLDDKLVQLQVWEIEYVLNSRKQKLASWLRNLDKFLKFGTNFSFKLLIYLETSIDGSTQVVSYWCKVNDFEPFLLFQFFVLSDVRNIVHEYQNFLGLLALVLELL